VRIRLLLTAFIATVAISLLPASASAENLWSISGASGTAYITNVDNSGVSRSLSLYQTLYKSSGYTCRKVEYKMYFGPNVRTDWKGGISKCLNGYTAGTSKDTFYY